MVLQVVPSEAAVYKLSLKQLFGKINRKTLVMEFSVIEVGSCNFTIKELHQRFFPVNFDVRVWNFTSILKAITVLFLLHFDSCPAEAIIPPGMRHRSDVSIRSHIGRDVADQVREWDGPIWDVFAMSHWYVEKDVITTYQLIPKWDWPI